VVANLRLAWPTAILALTPVCLLAQDRISEFRTRFAQETDALHRAQAMPKLGEAEFDEITKNVDTGKLPTALAVLKEYRDEIQSCEKGLDARKIDAERHPKGYKQLEISLRQALRKLNNLLVGFTADEQAPFLEVRSDLEESNRHLIRSLFPKGPNDDTAPPD
jgi:hypothetical protein